MRMTVSLQELIELEHEAVSSYRIWSVSAMDVQRKLDAATDRDKPFYKDLLEHDMQLVEKARTNMATTRRDLAKYFRDLLEENVA